jgi:hypothetical protein
VTYDEAQILNSQPQICAIGADGEQPDPNLRLRRRERQGELGDEPDLRVDTLRIAEQIVAAGNRDRAAVEGVDVDRDIHGEQAAMAPQSR